MFQDQKTKRSGLTTARLILAGIALISFVTVVCVAGYLSGKKPVVVPQPIVSSVPEITIIPTTTITPDVSENTDDRKTYRNEEYGFEVKYPEDWKNEGNENEYFFQTWFESENTELFIRTDLKGEVNPFTLPSFPICYEKNRPLVLFDKELPKFIASSIEEGVDEQECENFLLSNEHFIRSEFCINEKLEVYPPEVIKGWQEYGYKCGENKDSEILYDFQLFCNGAEWQGREGLEKCNKLFDQILSTFQFLNKETFIDKVTFGNLSAYINRDIDYNYVILSEGGKETIIDKGPVTYNKGVNDEWSPVWFGGPSFSPKGNYLLYGAGMHEGAVSYVYDIKNKKIALTSSGGRRFTLDEKYVYVCVEGGMGSHEEGRIFSIPDFKVIYDVLESPFLGGKYYTDIQCVYEPKTESIIFNVAHNMIKYSLSDNKEYRMDNEADYKWPLYGE